LGGGGGKKKGVRSSQVEGRGKETRRGEKSGAAERSRKGEKEKKEKEEEKEKEYEKALEFVGRRVEVYWEGEDEWFGGVVDRFDPAEGKKKKEIK
jgi:hypothetical protein